MILGKVMMLQNGSEMGSVDYLICKKILASKEKIIDYTLNEFIDEVGVSKASMIRFLKKIDIPKFSRFKRTMYEEYMRAYHDMKLMKKELETKTIDNKYARIARELKKYKRILMLGDGNRYALIIYQKALMYLGIDLEIPVYTGSEESVVKDYEFKEGDAVLFINIHESFDSFLVNRSMFYMDSAYLKFDVPCDVFYIGLEGKEHSEIKQAYYLTEEEYSKKMNEMQILFKNIFYYILKNTHI